MAPGFRVQETIQRIQSQVDDNETRLQSVDRNQAWMRWTFGFSYSMYASKHG
jgi:hypothetical protein